MKRPNITPGPWHHSKGVSPAINTQLERTPINIARTIYGSYDEALANARAIAAVPELLAALEALVRESGRSMDDLDSDVSSHRTLLAAYEALTKAGYEFP